MDADLAMTCNQGQTSNYGALWDLTLPGSLHLWAKCTGVELTIQELFDGSQARALSMMDKFILVRSILSSMPVYFLSNRILPKTLMVKLEQHFQSFLWGSHPGGGGVRLLA